MVEEIGALPAGALEFGITGKLSRDELRVFAADQLDQATAWLSE